MKTNKIVGKNSILFSRLYYLLLFTIICQRLYTWVKILNYIIIRYNYSLHSPPIPTPPPTNRVSRKREAFFETHVVFCSNIVFRLRTAKNPKIYRCTCKIHVLHVLWYMWNCLRTCILQIWYIHPHTHMNSLKR